jgi:crotonobetainyl-CoA:carnitine CoA-transferase CaiB-like acyl-CoA transferase
VFSASDGDVVIAAMSDDQFVRMCNALAMPELLSDPR